MTLVFVTADTRDLQHYERELKKLSMGGVGYAIAQAVTDVARQAEREWKQELADRFTLRNHWTSGSIRSVAAKPGLTRNIEARVGSLLPYLKSQEEGDTLRGKQGGAKSIPVDWARMGGSKKKLVAKPNQAQNITLAPRRARSSRRKNVSAIRQAQKRGQRYVLLEKGQKRGIFKIGGGKRKAKLTLIQTLSHTSVRIKPAKTMKPAVMRAQSFAPQAFRAAFSYQLYRLSKYKR